MSPLVKTKRFFWAGAVVAAVTATLALTPGMAKGNDTFAEQPAAQVAGCLIDAGRVQSSMEDTSSASAGAATGGTQGVPS